MSKLGDKLKNGKLVTWVKEKAPGIASTVLNLAGTVTGVDGFSDLADKVSGLIPANLKGEWEMKMKEFELEFYKVQAEVAMEMEKLAVADRDSARKREMEMIKSGKRDWMQYVVGIVGLSLLIYLTYNIVTKPDMSDNVLLVHLLGIIEGVALSIFAYYFGSSKGSKDKTRMMSGGEK